MYTREHLWISAVVFGSLEGILGGVIPDIFFIPVFLHDFWRELHGLEFERLENFWVKANWFLHSVWFLGLLLLACWWSGHMIFWKGYFLHIVLDVCTHSNQVAWKPFYPLSLVTLDLWRLGYVKRTCSNVD